MKKALFLLNFIVIGLFAWNAHAVPSQASCKRAVDSANKENRCKPSTSTALPGTSAGLYGAADGITNGLSEVTKQNAAYVQGCEKFQQKCEQECQGIRSGEKDLCDHFKREVEKAKQQVESDNQDKEKSKKSAEGSGGMPQMPQPPKDDQKQDNQQQQAVAAPASATVDCAANPAGEGCNKPMQDASNNPATPAGFSGGDGGGGSAGGSGSPSSFGSSEQPTQTAAAGAGITPPGGSSGGGLGSGGSNSNPNKEMSPAAYDAAAKSITDVLNGERGGGGGGGGAGGGFSYGSGYESSSLANYLPGRKLDPNKPKAAGDRKPASMEVASVHADIFAMISKRFQILCKLREIRDCD